MCISYIHKHAFVSVVYSVQNRKTICKAEKVNGRFAKQKSEKKKNMKIIKLKLLLELVNCVKQQKLRLHKKINKAAAN